MSVNSEISQKVSDLYRAGLADKAAREAAGQILDIALEVKNGNNFSENFLLIAALAYLQLERLQPDY